MGTPKPAHCATWDCRWAQIGIKGAELFRPWNSQGPSPQPSSQRARPSRLPSSWGMPAARFHSVQGSEPTCPLTHGPGVCSRTLSTSLSLQHQIKCVANASSARPPLSLPRCPLLSSHSHHKKLSVSTNHVAMADQGRQGRLGLPGALPSSSWQEHRTSQVCAPR